MCFFGLNQMKTVPLLKLNDIQRNEWQIVSNAGQKCKINIFFSKWPFLQTPLPRRSGPQMLKFRLILANLAFCIREYIQL